jgi:hypothetical protein
MAKTVRTFRVICPSCNVGFTADWNKSGASGMIPQTRRSSVSGVTPVAVRGRRAESISGLARSAASASVCRGSQPCSSMPNRKRQRPVRQEVDFQASLSRRVYGRFTNCFSVWQEQSGNGGERESTPARRTLPLSEPPSATRGVKSCPVWARRRTERTGIVEHGVAGQRPGLPPGRTGQTKFSCENAGRARESALRPPKGKWCLAPAYVPKRQGIRLCSRNQAASHCLGRPG